MVLDNMRHFFIAIMLLILFQRCSLINSNKEVNIVKQELIYDSLFNNSKTFNVKLRTKLQFKNKSIKRKEYNDFLIIIKNDTFPLVPEVNNIEKISASNKIEINYLSYINFKSKKYENDSLKNIIVSSSRIIYSDGEEIGKNDSYFFDSLIMFHNPKKDGRVYK